MQHHSSAHSRGRSASFAPQEQCAPQENYALPAGAKRNATVARLGAPPDFDDDESESDSDNTYGPPPRARAPGGDGGLRAVVPAPPPPYWDADNHRAACLAELQDLANAGATWSQVDASEGDSECDIDSEDEEEEDEQEEDMNDPALPPQC